ncbi:HAD family phosphatase [Lipingzhangella sp. LS1_29]|uniref:HAD family phosphatase n=1 Tax=Lipingzhangella rawalii TaxID=2055835 RepID=A0ABU2H551_9ACTN|nr:HAD family phosphatase [Lipingzhangella rawalii]MDS1270431.1 HAD family phosphatase [Lipingzhangella rawalii]
MDNPRRGVIVDWAGVLTSPLASTIEAWIRAEGIDAEHYYSVMRAWAGDAYRGHTPDENPIRALERGELAPERFERELAGALRRTDGSAVNADGLLHRMFAGFQPAPQMYALLREVRAQGLRTCLLSNSWGNSYPRAELASVFDALVISGEVGMRKPEVGIFEHALAEIGLAPQECVFIDDMRPNTEAAQSLGMPAILHRDPDTTRRELHETHRLALAPTA